MKLFKSLLVLALCLSIFPFCSPQFAWADEEGLDDTSTLDDQNQLSAPGEGLDDSFDMDDQDQLSAPGEGSDGIDDDEELSVIDGELQGLLSPTSDEAAVITPFAAPSVSYRAHVANIGWQALVKDGAMAGTTGRALAMEGINIELIGNGLAGSIRYRANADGIGLQAWVKNGALAGTTGQSRRMEIIRIELEGDIALEYSVYYRVHVANIGWLGWTKDGAPAGSAGYKNALEAIEIRLVEKDQTGPTSTTAAFVSLSGEVNYQAHVANIGWQARVADGKVAGTTGRGLAMEGLYVELIDPAFSGSIEYRSHVANVGWQSWRSNGALSGTTGQARQMEAVQIRLTGDMAKNYDVYYKAHSSVYGWLGWAKNGEMAGTSGFGLALQALMIVLVPIDGGTPPAETSAFGPYAAQDFSFRAHVANRGWLASVGNRQFVGIVGSGLRMEAFTITNNGSSIEGGIRYAAYANGLEWSDWLSDGQTAGTTGESRQLEAIRIELIGDMAKYFDIYYRTHISFYGWMGWAKNGASAGTTKCGIPLEAFEVAIVPKGSPAPGSTNNAYSETLSQFPGLATMSARVASLSSSTGWLLAIDSTYCRVGVYQGSRGNWTLVYYWLCAPGLPRSATPKGVFSVGNRGYVFGSGFSCYWWVQFYGECLTHSVPYYPGSNTIMDNTLGAPASAGCVRLDIDNAKWIYDNIPRGTTVLSF